MMKVIQLIMLFVTITIAYNHRSHLAKILKTQNSFFGKTNENLHKILNKILESLNIDENFTTPSTIKLLLTMHYGLNNIAEKACEVYDEVRNTIRLSDNETENKLFTLNIINEILNERPFKRKIIEKIFQVTEDKIEARDLKSEEVREFTNDYLMKLNILNFDDLNDKTDNRTESSDDDDDMSAPNINLKVWDTSHENSTETRRLYNGVESKVETYPFVASIHVMGEFTCAGSIISTNMVITAASCLQIAYNSTHFKLNDQAIVIRVGSDYMSRGGKVLPVLQVFFHPAYDPVNLWNNLAIMRIQRRLRFSKKSEKIRRILVDKNTEVLPYKVDKVTVLGWGARDASQTVDPVKKISVGSLEVYHIDECKEIYSSQYVTDKNFCAGYLTKGGGACNRDIGGPGVINKFLSGVVSFASPTCGEPNSPTVFVNLGYYGDWIDQILGQDQISDGTSFSRTTAVTDSQTYFMRTTFRSNKESITPPLELTTQTTVIYQEMSMEYRVNATMREVNRTKSEGNGAVEDKDKSWSDLSDNYEEESENNSSASDIGIALSSERGGATNDTGEEIVEVNVSEMNDKYGDDNVFVWDTQPKEVQIRKHFKN